MLTFPYTGGPVMAENGFWDVSPSTVITGKKLEAVTFLGGIHVYSSNDGMKLT